MLVRPDGDDQHAVLGFLVVASEKLHRLRQLYSRYRTEGLEQPERQPREDEVLAAVDDQQVGARGLHRVLDAVLHSL